MAEDVAGQIKQVVSMSRQQLLDLWEKLHGKSAHLKIRRELMVPLLAYRIQEIAYGGLKPSTKSELRGIARGLEKSSGSKKINIRQRIRPATRSVNRATSSPATLTFSEAAKYSDSNRFDWPRSVLHSLASLAISSCAVACAVRSDSRIVGQMCRPSAMPSNAAKIQTIIRNAMSMGYSYRRPLS